MAQARELPACTIDITLSTHNVARSGLNHCKALTKKKRNPGICYELAVIYSTNFRVMDSMETLQMIHTFR